MDFWFVSRDVLGYGESMMTRESVTSSLLPDTERRRASPPKLVSKGTRSATDRMLGARTSQSLAKGGTFGHAYWNGRERRRPNTLQLMQRLFSMFPRGWPGIALLLLRLALGATLLNLVPGLPTNLDWAWADLVPSLVALLISVGILTPLTSVLCVVVEIVAWHVTTGALQAIHICAVLVAVAVTMLGPGAYSLDARIFGRRQIVFPPNDDPGQG